MTAFFCCLAVCAGLALLYIFLIAPSPRPDRMRPFYGTLFAHRGLWNEERPENSLSAFREAVKQGCGIETDVQCTADDKLVLFHDDTLLRMCGTDEKLSALSFEETQKLRLQNSAERIPTLEELLKLVKGKVPLLIEIKTGKEIGKTCALTMEMLKGYSGGFLIESFDPRALLWFRRHAPDVLRGQLALGLTKGSEWPRTALMRLLSSLIVNALSRPAFMALDYQTDHTLPVFLCSRFRSEFAAWTVRDQADMNALTERYSMQIFEGFLPENPYK